MAHPNRTKSKAAARRKSETPKRENFQGGIFIFPAERIVRITDGFPFDEAFQSLEEMRQNFAPEDNSVQEAYRNGYPEFVNAPVKRIESSWAKIDQSLRRMEKKLQGIAG